MSKEETNERRQQLRLWLARDGMTRRDLAEQLGVSEASAYGWLSCTNIPDKRWKQLKEVFEKKEEIERNRIVGTTLSDEEMISFEKAAEKMGMSKEDLFRECILRQLKQDLQK